MTREELAREEYELALIKAQVSLVVKQSRTEFWKVGIAAVVGGAVVGGLIVQIVNVIGA